MLRVLVQARDLLHVEAPVEQSLPRRSSARALKAKTAMRTRPSAMPEGALLPPDPLATGVACGRPACFSNSLRSLRSPGHVNTRRDPTGGALTQTDRLRPSANELQLPSPIAKNRTDRFKRLGSAADDEGGHGRHPEPAGNVLVLIHIDLRSFTISVRAVTRTTRGIP